MTLLTVLVVGLVITAPTNLAAQNPHVEYRHALHFGKLYRSMRTFIDYRSGSAAYMVVCGRPGAVVQVHIMVSDLSLPSGETMPVDVRGSNCAFSVDGGVHWEEFSSELSVQTLTFPDSPLSVSEIHVRVGGEVRVGDAQRRGDYTCRVDLFATYLQADGAAPIY